MQQQIHPHCAHGVQQQIHLLCADGVQEAAAIARRRPFRGGRGGGGSGRPERPPQHRYESVKSHWTALPAERRRRLLTVPVKRLARGTVSACPACTLRDSPRNPFCFGRTRDYQLVLPTF